MSAFFRFLLCHFPDNPLSHHPFSLKLNIRIPLASCTPKPQPSNECPLFSHGSPAQP